MQRAAAQSTAQAECPGAQASQGLRIFLLHKSLLSFSLREQKSTVGDQEEPAAVKLGGESLSQRQSAQQNCRCLPGQKPGLRNREGIRGRECRGSRGWGRE